jgi:large subunit ribosomal protein L13
MEVEKFDVVIDAKDRVLGRIASRAAKEALSGKSVAVVNAESAFITGSKRVVAKRYRTRLNLQEKANPEHSPYWSRRPDMLVRRVIRGMMPYRKPTGKSAYRRLRVYSGMPKELGNHHVLHIETSNPKTIYVKYVYIKELSKLLGYNRE